MVEINTPWLDKDRIFSIDEVMNVISNSFGAKLRGAIFGHAHQEVEMESENGPLLGTPSTCFQFLPKSPKFAVDQKAPGYRWLFLEADGGLTSKLERLTTLSFKPTMK
jgi:Icc protein